MSNVIQFPARAPAPEAEVDVPEQDMPNVAEMLKQSSAMTVIATLQFYALQGWDGGKKARDAMPALQRLLATKGVHA